MLNSDHTSDVSLLHSLQWPKLLNAPYAPYTKPCYFVSVNGKKKKGGPPKPGETVSHCCHLVFQLKLWSCTYRTSKSGCMDEDSNLLVGVDGVKYSDWMLRWDRTTCCASCSLCHSYFTLGRLGSIKTHQNAENIPGQKEQTRWLQDISRRSVTFWHRLMEV